MLRDESYTHEQIKILLKKLDDYMIDLAANHPNKWAERKESYFAILDAIERQDKEKLQALCLENEEKFKSKSSVKLWQQYADMLHELVLMSEDFGKLYGSYLSLRHKKQSEFFKEYDLLTRASIKYKQPREYKLKINGNVEVDTLDHIKVKIAACVGCLSEYQLGINNIIDYSTKNLNESIKKIVINCLLAEEEHNRALAKAGGIGKSGDLGKILSELKTLIVRYYPWMLNDEGVLKLKDALLNLDETLFGTGFDQFYPEFYENQFNYMTKDFSRYSLAAPLRSACFYRKSPRNIYQVSLKEFKERGVVFTPENVKKLCELMKDFNILEDVSHQGVCVVVDLKTEKDLKNLLAFIENAPHSDLQIIAKNFNLLKDSQAMKSFWDSVNHSTLQKLVLVKEGDDDIFINANMNFIFNENKEEADKTLKALCDGIKNSSLLDIDLRRSVFYWGYYKDIRLALRKNYKILEFCNIVGFDPRSGEQDVFWDETNDVKQYLYRNNMLFRIENMIENLNHDQIDEVKIASIQSKIANIRDHLKDKDKLKIIFKKIDDAEFRLVADLVNSLLRKEVVDEKPFNAWFSVSSSSSWFSDARREAFGLLYNHYYREEGMSNRRAFINALHCCLNDDNKFIEFSRDSQLLFDGYLFAAAGLKDMDRLADLSTEDRLVLLQYVVLREIEQCLPPLTNLSAMFKDRFEDLKKQLRKLPDPQSTDEKITPMILEAWKAADELTNGGKRLTDENVQLVYQAINQLAVKADKKPQKTPDLKK